MVWPTVPGIRDFQFIISNSGNSVPSAQISRYYIYELNGIITDAGLRVDGLRRDGLARRYESSVFFTFTVDDPQLRACLVICVLPYRVARIRRRRIRWRRSIHMALVGTAAHSR